MLGRQAGTLPLQCLCKQAYTRVCLALQHRISGLMSAIQAPKSQSPIQGHTATWSLTGSRFQCEVRTWEAAQIRCPLWEVEGMGIMLPGLQCP